MKNKAPKKNPSLNHYDELPPTQMFSEDSSIPPYPGNSAGSWPSGQNASARQTQSFNYGNDYADMTATQAVSKSAAASAYQGAAAAASQPYHYGGGYEELPATQMFEGNEAQPSWPGGSAGAYGASGAARQTSNASAGQPFRYDSNAQTSLFQEDSTPSAGTYPGEAAGQGYNQGFGSAEASTVISDAGTAFQFGTSIYGTDMSSQQNAQTELHEEMTTILSEPAPVTASSSITPPPFSGVREASASSVNDAEEFATNALDLSSFDNKPASCAFSQNTPTQNTASGSYGNSQDFYQESAPTQPAENLDAFGSVTYAFDESDAGETTFLGNTDNTDTDLSFGGWQTNSDLTDFTWKQADNDYSDDTEEDTSIMVTRLTSAGNRNLPADTLILKAAVNEQTPPSSLLIQPLDKQTAPILVQKPAVLCGRSKVCDWQLSSSTNISRYHAWLTFESDHQKWALQDMSANGTFINEVFSDPKHYTLLNEGDTIRFADGSRYQIQYC